MALTAPQIDRAVAASGTPLYAYSAPALRSRVAALKSALPDAEFVYSLKANPNLSIVRCLTGQGIGAEICSLFELETCLHAGVMPGDMIFVGPAKSEHEIARAVSIGIKAIIAESLEELALIERVARGLGVVQPVALRINPDFHTAGARLSMSGKPTQFGIDMEDVDAALAFVANAAQLRLKGIHVYMGTRILDHQVVAENTRNILALATDLMARCGQAFEFVDIGGGYGVPYNAGETALNLDALGEDVNAQIVAFRALHQHTKVLIELGRYMVAEAGVFVTKVRYTKTSKGKRFAICDGGSNIHTAAAQGASFRRNFPIAPVHPGDEPLGPWMLSGPLCTPTDIIGQAVELPELHAGDLIRIDRSGAYGLTASPAHFLSFATPAEVMVDGDTVTLIRERGTLEGHLDQQLPRTLAKPVSRKTTEEAL